MSEISTWLSVCVGGATGAILRGLIYRGIEQWSPADGPGRLAEFGSARSTLLVNTLGSFLLGFVLASLAPSSSSFGDPLAAFWVTGLCGALTTFSALCADATRFARRGHRIGVAVVLLANMVVAVAALALGVATASF